MLIAGAGVSSSSAQGGAFPFNVDVLPLTSDWSVGSANMLIAGAGTCNPSAIGGTFTFHVNALPSYTWWYYGSAPCWCGCWRTHFCLWWRFDVFCW